MRVLPFIILLIGLTSTVSGGETTITIRPPQFTPPPSGITVDKSFDITLDAAPSGSCVSIVLNKATILIPRQILEQLKAAKPRTWNREVKEIFENLGATTKEPKKKEQQRLAYIDGRRAEALLQLLTESNGKFGCTPLQKPTSPDSLYLINKLLQSGQVAVIDNETHQSIRHIVVHFKGVRLGPHAGFGHISYSFTKQSASFLMLRWWIS